MEAKEFRLGNLVNVKEVDLNNGGERIDVVEIDRYLLDELIRGNRCNRFSPITLTEGWLLRFGFVKFDNRGGYCKEEDDYNFVLSKTIGGYDNDVCLYVIEYVHQLQNIYYSLTGEELQPSRLEKPGA